MSVVPPTAWASTEETGMSDYVAIASPAEILHFWFEELTREDWFNSSPELDASIRKRFAETHLTLAKHISEEWHETPEAFLAAIIVLDQLPRNMYRATPLAFATDGLALRQAKLAVQTGVDRKIPIERRVFVYMPYEHSEAIEDQMRCVELMETLGNEEFLDYARRHHEVIAEYGRFPHRNAILGRQSTAAEESYLAKPGAGF
jgi:uncharacterized protein (DUF924 family)